MINKDKKIYIGSAWPYANGSLHLGHVSALLGADILARYLRQSGADVLWTSGTDCHGTPVEVEAQRQKKKPEEIAKHYHREFRQSLIDGLGFSFDNYSNTLTESHTKIVQEIFLKLYEQGDIYTKTQRLPYCKTCQRFLPDRYIEGECPNCHYKSARGDQCDECGDLLDAKDLINPKCKTCSNKPEFRESEHFFLKLSKHERDIQGLLDKAEGWRANAKGFTKKFLNEGLQDRAVSRDTKWGIPIPIRGYEDKSIYVWFEAVSGYFTASIEWAKQQNNPDAWREFWQNKEAYHYYVHGKDNIPFHTIIWPTILMGYDDGLHLPDSIISSEYLTLEKKQFSKSRKWAVWLPDYLKNFESDSLRYYLVANGPETSDADFSWNEFAQRTNKELIGNLANFIYRSAQLIENNFKSGLQKPEKYDEYQTEVIEYAIGGFEKVGNLIEQGKFREGLKYILEIAERGNKFLAKCEPWKKIKDDKTQTANDLFVCGQLIYCISSLVEPFLPSLSQKINSAISKNSNTWKFESVKSVKIENLEPLVKKIEQEQVEKEISKLG